MTHGNNQPVVLNPGEGNQIMVGDSKIFIKLSSQNTDQRFSITEYELPPKFPGPPPHKHKQFEHAWFVLEGDLNVELDNSQMTLVSGSFVFIPKKTVHAFSNKSDLIVKVLVFDTPGGFEKYYEDIQQAFSNGRALDATTFREIQLKYDTYPPDHLFD